MRLFSSVSEAERVRRPTDYVLLVLGGVLLVLSAVASESSGATEAAAAAFVDVASRRCSTGCGRSPPTSRSCGPPCLLVIAVVARARRRLVRDQLLAGVLAGLVALLCHRVVEGAWPTLDELLGNGAPVTYPAGRLAVAVAMT